MAASSRSPPPPTGSMKGRPVRPFFRIYPAAPDFSESVQENDAFDELHHSNELTEIANAEIRR